MPDDVGAAAVPGLVSVVIPTRDRAALLPRAIRSVLAQTHAGWELIVVDDGCRDETAQVVQGFGDARISRVRHDAARGCPASRNTGAAHARGEFLAFLDDDDEWLPGHLASRLAVVGRPGVHGCFGPQYVCGRGGRLIRRGGRPRPPGMSMAEYIIARRGKVQASTLVVRRDSFLALRSDEALRNHEDWDLAIRFDEAFGLGCDPRRTVIRHDDGSGRLTGRFHLPSVERFLGRHGPRVSPRARALFRCRLAFRISRGRSRDVTWLELLERARREAPASREVRALVYLMSNRVIGGAATRAWGAVARARVYAARRRLHGMSASASIAPHHHEP